MSSDLEPTNNSMQEATSNGIITRVRQVHDPHKHVSIKWANARRYFKTAPCHKFGLWNEGQPIFGARWAMHILLDMLNDSPVLRFLVWVNWRIYGGKL